MHALPCKFSGGRKSTGSSIAEFAPALFIMLIIILFPFIDLVTMGLSYGCGSMLNSTQLREATVTKSTTARTGSIINTDLVNNWASTGIGQFTKSSNILTQINYLPGVNPDGQGISDVFVEVRTTITVAPFLQLPFFNGVPGLGAPITYTYDSQQLLEDSQNYDLGTWDTTKSPPRVTSALPDIGPTKGP